MFAVFTTICADIMTYILRRQNVQLQTYSGKTLVRFNRLTIECFNVILCFFNLGNKVTQC